MKQTKPLNQVHINAPNVDSLGDLIFHDDSRNQMLEFMKEKSLDSKVSLEKAETAICKRFDNGLHCQTTKHGVHYHKYDGSSDKTPILLFHAMGGNCHNWLPVIQHLPHDVPIYAIDLPWHGQSRGTKSNRIDYEKYYVSWMNELLADLNLAKIHLVGHSLGARISATFSFHNPEKVASLTMLAPALYPAFKGMTLLQSRVLRIFPAIHNKATKRLILRSFMHMMLIKKNKVTRNYLNYAIEELIRDQSQAEWNGLRHALEWLSEKDVNTERLEDLSDKLPVYILYGNEDGYCPVVKLKNSDKGSIQLTKVKQSGHLLPLEHPLLCANAITAAIN